MWKSSKSSGADRPSAQRGTPFFLILVPIICAVLAISVGILVESPGFGGAVGIGLYMGVASRHSARNANTAEDWATDLNGNPARVAARKREAQLRQRRMIECQEAETPLVEELQAIGLKVTSAWDLVHTVSPYVAALPILLRHLDQPYPDRVREGIARALAVQEARFGWDTLKRLYEAEKPGTYAKDGIAVALAASCDETVLSDLVDLARDRGHGESRLLLLLGLERSRNARVPDTLDELSGDPLLAPEIRRIRKRRS